MVKFTDRFIFLFLIASISMLASCSKRLYSETNPDQKNQLNITAPSNSKGFKAFMAGGTEKKLNTGSTKAGEIIKTAHEYLGVPHCMGGSSKKCTDCSGMVMAVFAEHGISLPHSAEEQARYGKIIKNKSQLRKGDLVFFIKSYKTSKYITHSGIYTGNNEFIHTSSQKGVTITSLNNSWWNDKFIFGTRILDN